MILCIAIDLNAAKNAYVHKRQTYGRILKANFYLMWKFCQLIAGMFVVIPTT